MTTQAAWQIFSAAILVTVIAAGFVWFERTRPTARGVSLVAALVAFAVIGRILFAPFPNVKPTTDIVIVAGFVLGFAPGWIVGTLAALVSNFFFMQGPWTPWQMVAWGLCGLLGALLARVTDGRTHRLPMALACAGAGLLYGLILNFQGAINAGGPDLLNSFWIQLGTAIPFDIAHALGNFAFFMLAGPLLITMLERLKSRGDLVWPASESDAAHSSTPA